MIGVDTSVLVDLHRRRRDQPTRPRPLRAALSPAPVVLCDVVVSEVWPGWGTAPSCCRHLEEPASPSADGTASALRAGEMQRRYGNQRDRRPPAVRRTVPDFLIGAHALMQCTALITRDAGFYRDYFKGLKVIVPKA
jgi:predicted nucleic acid-binding protein